MTNSKPKILIIDDERPIRDIIEFSLSGEGYELYFAENGKEGLSILKEVSPVLVTLDIGMPVMDGFEFLEKIQLKPTDPYSVIMLTGYGSDEEKKKCYDLGAHLFLSKPFEVVELRSLINQSLELKQALDR